MRNLKSALITARLPNARPILVLDFDTREQYREFPMRARMLARWFGYSFSHFFLCRYRTQKGWHIIIYTDLKESFSPLEIVTAQAILGSDWKREVFNFIRSYHVNEAPESWQKTGRWNTTYSHKLGVISEGVRKTTPSAVHSPDATTNERTGA